jgi:hypothetical protein
MGWDIDGFGDDDSYCFARIERKYCVKFSNFQVIMLISLKASGEGIETWSTIGPRIRYRARKHTECGPCIYDYVKWFRAAN